MLGDFITPPLLQRALWGWRGKELWDQAVFGRPAEFLNLFPSKQGSLHSREEENIPPILRDNRERVWLSHFQDNV